MTNETPGVEIADNPEVMYDIYEGLDNKNDRIKLAEEYIRDSADIWTVIYARSDPDKKYDDSLKAVEILTSVNDYLIKPETKKFDESFMLSVDRYIQLVGAIHWLEVTDASQLDATDKSILLHKTEHLDASWNEFLTSLDLAKTIDANQQVRETLT